MASHFAAGCSVREAEWWGGHRASWRRRQQARRFQPGCDPVAPRFHTNIPALHSSELHALNPQATTLWIVPGATHVAAVVAAPEQYEQRIVSWFGDHR